MYVHKNDMLYLLDTCCRCQLVSYPLDKHMRTQRVYQQTVNTGDYNWLRHTDWYLRKEEEIKINSP